MILNGSEILIESLLEHNVDTIFGYPGGAVLNIYDVLYKYKDKIHHVLTAHEQGAAHAADGYARSTGKVGVCLATSGPGATNLVTGIATAYMDSIPLIAITGNVPRELLGKDSFQEVDIAGITMPITKHNYIVDNIEKLQHTIIEAFYIAQSGRPGPVLIDIPKDVTMSKCEYKRISPKIVKRKFKYITENSLDKVAKLINTSERPFIYVGGGVISAGASNELEKLSEKIGAPTAASLMGITACSWENKFFTGMIGMHGTKASNILATKSDLIICIGARFSDRVISNRKHIENAKIIHLDVDPAEINKNLKSDEYIIGDIKVILNKLMPLLDDKKNQQWIRKIYELKQINNKTNKEQLEMEGLFNYLNKLTKGECILVTDVGQHQMWTALHYKFKYPRSFITSGGLGTMGFGVGAAIGAQLANKNKRVILITGDGSFGMNCNEMATIASNKLPIKIIVINNNALGMVRQWQTLFYNERYSQTTLNRNTDFVKLAEAFGIKAYRINGREDFEDILKEALYSNESTLIDFCIHENIKVFPMVAPGNSLDDIILYDIKEELYE
ncbi:biosynthetic-type acetolactate synthase large subunit [Clostridium tarantellae]|uniref:Acetolactate synthase n=1 Tax=Clostridium tarantellae TaxID=39493 RepID=A0A6I1MIU0_9CLOT|nr:biosynthetic-type acetolactate synthase large subunit [Clostridium tarantellae]MPQ42318.1 biosynthetic-type acetolactate synthase large subunit [Clostridium tarantellae]